MIGITLGELEKGCASFSENESRDAMYKIACKLVTEGWNKPADVADGLGVVLLTWNQAAYRYGSFDFDELEDFLKKNEVVLNSFRKRNIRSFRPNTDEVAVKTLFEGALDALAFTEARRKTPVGAAKALHILAPSFFPLWDQEIAKECGYYWYSSERASAKYVAFMGYAQATIAALEEQFDGGGRPSGLPPARSLAASLSKRAGRSKTMLKFLDEYLYSKYTQGWIKS